MRRLRKEIYNGESMKNNIIFAFAIFAAVFFADNSQADDFTYFNTTLCRDYIEQGSSASDKIEIKINLYTRINPLKKKGNLSRTREIHNRACKSFKKRGWNIRDPFFEATDAGSIEIIQEERMKGVVTKTFLYLCTDDKLWNMVKYRGGSFDKYLEKVVNKAENCIKEKFDVR